MLIGLVLRTESDYNILDGRIKMRWREYLRYLTPRYTLVHAVKYFVAHYSSSTVVSQLTRLTPVNTSEDNWA